jgi:hypothetical protein
LHLPRAQRGMHQGVTIFRHLCQPAPRATALHLAALPAPRR